MTLTMDDATREAAVAGAVDADPVKALMGAERDGLLSYHGFVGGGRYEVTFAGRRWELPAAEVLPTVERLRSVASLGAVGVKASLAAVHEDGVHVLYLQDGARLVELPAGEVVDWCAGYVAAAVGEGQEHAGTERVYLDADGAPAHPTIAELFENASLDDQCRMVILGLMHGGPERVSNEDLVARIGGLPGVERPPAKKTVVDALGFGQYMASDLKEKMIAAFGLRWAVSAGPGRCEHADGAPVERVPEMPGLVRLQRLVAAAGNGWLRYVDEPSPNKARWLRRYQVTVGERGYVISAGGLDAWLDGMAAYHHG